MAKIAKVQPIDGVQPWEQSGYHQGDIVFGGGFERNGIRDLQKRWPGGKVPYYIDASYCEQAICSKLIIMQFKCTVFSLFFSSR